MQIVYAFVGVILAVIVYFWFTYIRVPPSIKHLPALPFIWAKPSERRRITRELSKTHALARMWLMRWTVVVLHPEPAKTVEVHHTVYEKLGKGRFPRWSMSRAFIPEGNVVGAQTEEWKRHRMVINPAFETAYIRAFTTVFAEIADVLVDKLRQYDCSTPVPVHDWLQRYTLDCLGKSTLGFDFQSVQDPNSVFAQTYHRITGPQGVFNPLRFATPLSLYDLLPTAGNRQLRRDLKDWNGLVNRMTKFGETASDSDLSRHLLKATAPNAPNPLTLDEVRADLSVFFVAGHETSAISVSAALWYLARYPEIQDKVYEEIVSVCGKTDSPTYEGQQKLTYLTQVLYEGNRLTPPVAALPARIIVEDTELCGLKLKKGTALTVSIDSLHYLEREWPNPEEFNPDRFAPEREEHRHPFSWQPFGAGPRACLGRNFSVLEQRVVMAKILQAFRVCLPAGAPTTIETNNAPGLVKVLSKVTLHPRA